MNYEHIFDSSKSTYEVEFEIDRSISDTITVLFEKENIVLTADSHGAATFARPDGTEIKKVKAEADRLFGSIYCSVKEGVITVTFPVTETIDHYPNCDGEYDRYSKKIIDNILVTCPVTE